MKNLKEHMTRFAKNNAVPGDLSCSGVSGFPYTHGRYKNSYGIGMYIVNILR